MIPGILHTRKSVWISIAQSGVKGKTRQFPMLRLDEFEIQSISPDIITETFNCRSHPELAEYLKDEALEDHMNRVAATTVVLDRNRVIAYYTLACSAIRFKDKKVAQENGLEGGEFPAIHLGRFAVQDKYQGQSLGTQLLEYLIGHVSEQTETLGCKLIVCEAYKEAVKWYERNDFLPRRRYYGKLVDMYYLLQA